MHSDHRDFCLWHVDQRESDCTCIGLWGNPPVHHQQSRMDSFMESLTNTAIGFVLSLITWQLVAGAYGIPMPIGLNIQITLIFTIVSIARQYVLRRTFDGRSPRQWLKGKL